MFNAILPLLFSLLSCAYAAPLTAQKADGPIGLHVGGGIVGFLVLVLDVIVWIEVLQSTRPISHKLLWALLVFIFPIVGVIIYFLFSNRKAHMGGYEAIP
ncbi:hypothetical protein BDY17DRAFT_321165 [Neohortaea acidophila]|uniref:Cardiolipin synthase N-terminal domain-containing protein n=1 Tax=Neohortaea acidophila TaxID=245834 RepID=A0A6A6Q286_9PEZI|nr:uncharacterized protein BDY17DRAFT_321165 [Neohortaea acidophila]KAF2486362.1 hypothetical protein BDY17DRAFT_321165 [Neohortaea acidophila]